MDSRGNPHGFLHGVPFGIFRSYQNLGGVFRLTWSDFVDSVVDERNCLRDRGRPMAIIILDHYSASDNERLGCAGHKGNIAQARDINRSLRNGLVDLFLDDHEVVSICGSIETDGDILTFWSRSGGDHITVSPKTSASDLEAWFRRHHPDTARNEHVIADLVDIGLRNARHQQELNGRRRTSRELGHSESMLFVGHSPEAFCQNGDALVISPFDPDLDRAIGKAAKILTNNAHKYRIRPGGRLVAVASAAYHSARTNDLDPLRANIARRDAVLRAKVLGDHLMAAAMSSGSVMRNWCEFLVCVVDMETMLAEPIS